MIFMYFCMKYEGVSHDRYNIAKIMVFMYSCIKYEGVSHDKYNIAESEAILYNTQYIQFWHHLVFVYTFPGFRNLLCFWNVSQTNIICLQVFINYRYQFNSERINCEKMLKVDGIMVWRVKLHCIILNSQFWYHTVFVCTFPRFRNLFIMLLELFAKTNKQTMLANIYG